MPYLLIGGVIAAIMFVVMIVLVLSRYKTCSSNEILVKYGKVGRGVSSKQIHGGATFVWPVIQKYGYMSLDPINTEIDLRGALSKQNIRVNVPSSFTIAIGTSPELMNSAAERLLGKDQEEIKRIASDIIFGQMRATIATMDVEEINGDREKFEKLVLENIEAELQKIGLYLINVNISDITDESGYLDALGKRAAAEAVNKAKVEVANSDRDGARGAATATAEQRKAIAEANAMAVTGENEAAVHEADSKAERQVAEANARRKSDAAIAVQTAEAQAEGYAAEKEAEDARAGRDRATRFANEVVPAQVAAEKAEIDAEAAKKVEVLAGEAAGERRRAELMGEAEGIKALVEAAGGDPKDAAMLMIVQQMPALIASQAEAISNIQFDKVVVIGGGDQGAGGAADFLRSTTSMLPGLHEIAKAAGLELPAFLGSVQDEGSSLIEDQKDTDTTSADGTSAENSVSEEADTSQQ